MGKNYIHITQHLRQLEFQEKCLFLYQNKLMRYNLKTIYF